MASALRSKIVRFIAAILASLAADSASTRSTAEEISRGFAERSAETARVSRMRAS